MLYARPRIRTIELAETASAHTARQACAHCFCESHTWQETSTLFVRVERFVKFAKGPPYDLGLYGKAWRQGK